MRRRRPADAHDLRRHLRAARRLEPGSGAAAAGGLNRGVQLPADVVGDVDAFYCLLSERRMAEKMQGGMTMPPYEMHLEWSAGQENNSK